MRVRENLEFEKEIETAEEELEQITGDEQGWLLWLPNMLSWTEELNEGDDS